MQFLAQPIPFQQSNFNQNLSINIILNQTMLKRSHLNSKHPGLCFRYINSFMWISPCKLTVEMASQGAQPASIPIATGRGLFQENKLFLC
uniref:Uncharacterized protein n=1 Tax=Rhizophora mucronata TaxID=61149 RepID=A0A2P2Q494_RHIMU